MNLTKEHLTRQMDIIPLDCLKRQITVVGAGAVGSFTVLALAKMGFENITVYDFDNIEIENLNSQFYRFKDVGKPKVEALKEIVKDFSDIDIKVYNEKYDDKIFSDIVVCAVDNMKTRERLMENHQKKGVFTNFVIDPRMAIEYAYIQCIKPMDPDDYRSYKKTLFSDEDGVRERCTGKSTIYTAQLMGATIAKIIKDIATSNDFIKRISWDIGRNEVVEQSMNSEFKKK